MSNGSKKLYNGLGKARDRRNRVIKRLELQLKLGLKPCKESEDILLEDSDIKRINKELAVLRTRI